MTNKRAWVEQTIAAYVAIYLGELSGNFPKGDLNILLTKIEWVLPNK